MRESDKFWDGFQWVTKSQAQYELEQKALLQECGASHLKQTDDELKKIAMSRTVIIENMSLHLGLTAKEIVRYIRDSLKLHGERGELTILDIDLNPFNNKLNNTSISL